MLAYLELLHTEEDRALFETLYKKYQHKMYYLSYEITKNTAESENIVHDTFLAIIENFEKIDENEPGKTWNYIKTIVRHKSYNYMKKVNRIEFTNEMEDLYGQYDVHEEFMRNEVKHELAAMIKTLKYPYKDTLYLYYYNELNCNQISEILEKSPENIREILHRARKKLKIRLDEEKGISCEI